MICFKDMTFCKSECKNTKCDRKLTDKVWSDAKKWWGSDEAPVAITDYSGDCEHFIK